MKIFNMTKEDFAKVPIHDDFSNTPNFRSLVIIPTEQAHESGWMCMEFVAVDKYGEPMFKMSGYSDVLHLDGIGGYGEWYRVLPEYVKPRSWFIDCLPCGYLRLNCKGEMKRGDGISDFEIYGVN